MNKEFVSYDLAVALKDLGFDEPSLGRFYTKPKCKMFGIDEHGRNYSIKNTPKKLYVLGEHFVLNDNNVITAPLYQQVFRWFREKHGWISNVWTICISTDGITSFEYAIDTLNDLGVSQYRENFPYKTYEEAELDCLKELIEIVKQKL